MDGGWDYINGFIERKSGGKFEGRIVIEGIDLSPISGVFFSQDGKNYLWLRRKEILEYNYELQQYTTRKREPRWEVYLEKQLKEDGAVAYRGDFYFMRFHFSVVGVWDNVQGIDKNRINLFVERMPMNEQMIINGYRNRIENDRQ